MGIFGGGMRGGGGKTHLHIRWSSRQAAAWEDEFDRRLAARTKVHGNGPRRMKGRWQVPDDLGHRYWRDGIGCCGCGKHDAAASDLNHHMQGPSWRGRPSR